MTSTTSTPRAEDSDSRRRPLHVLVAMLLLVSVITLPFAAGSVSATTALQDNDSNQTEPAGYYNNTSTDVNNETWMAGQEDATFENITTFAARLGTFVVGSDADRNAPTGPLIVGLTLLGAVIGMTIGTGIGIIGGAVLAIIALFGASAIGLFPFWLYGVGLFAIGLMLSASFKRVVA